MKNNPFSDRGGKLGTIHLINHHSRPQKIYHHTWQNGVKNVFVIGRHLSMPFSESHM